MMQLLMPWTVRVTDPAYLLGRYTRMKVWRVVVLPLVVATLRTRSHNQPMGAQQCQLDCNLDCRHVSVICSTQRHCNHSPGVMCAGPLVILLTHCSRLATFSCMHVCIPRHDYWMLYLLLCVLLPALHHPSQLRTDRVFLFSHSLDEFQFAKYYCKFRSGSMTIPVEHRSAVTSARQTTDPIACERSSQRVGRKVALQGSPGVRCTR